MTVDEIKERIMTNISDDTVGFITRVLKKMVEDASPADTEAEKYCKLGVGVNPEWKPLIDNLILEAEALGEDSSHVKILVDCFVAMVQSLAELVPKKASCMSKAELAFVHAVQLHRQEAVSVWLENWKKDILPLAAQCEDGDCWRRAIAFVLWAIYSLFQVSHANDDTPSVEIPDEDLVSEHAEVVVYYSASFTVRRCMLAKSVKDEEKKKKYQAFAEAHLLTAEEAKEAKLPAGMVEQREKYQPSHSFSRCSQGYFDFIKMVESTFLRNLTLKMMIACSEGDLIVQIGDAVMASEKIRAKFDELAEEAGIVDDADACKEIFEYVVSLFTGMRGRWFIKTVRGQESVQSIFSKAATRKKVANASDISKAKAEGSRAAATAAAAAADMAEKEVYDLAAKNLLDGASDAADDEIEEAMEARDDEEEGGE